MFCNTRSDNLPPIYFNNTQLPYTTSLKNLGVVCDKAFDLNVATDAALRTCIASALQVKRFVQERNLANRLHAHLTPQNNFNPSWCMQV